MGPLNGVRVLELRGIGPAPLAAMLLGDLGADVVRLDRPDPVLPGTLDPDPLQRNKRAMTCDLKLPADLRLCRGLAARADVLIEGFRPGTIERLGLDPADLLAANPRLVVCRVTGFGQEGPWAKTAGHDLIYLAYSGALHGLGRPGLPPQPPSNLVADYGGGAMLAVVGILAALFERSVSGLGQIVDAAMIDGVGLLTLAMRGLMERGIWQERRGENLLDGGSPFYDCYLAKDGEPVAIAPLEPRFYALLLEKLGLPADGFPQDDRARWPALRAEVARVIATRGRDEWAAIFGTGDACAAPVLKLSEAPGHPHHRARQSFVTVGGSVQAAPAPRFSRTPLAAPRPRRDEDERAAIARDWGLAADGGE